MLATDILMAEHRVIERVIQSIETNAQKLADGKDVRPGFFLDVADFIRGFADGCHHKKEENVLFKTMSESGLSMADGPISVMLNEHELGRSYTRQMRSAAEKLAQGDQTAREALIANSLGYAQLLRQHIMKEDNILFDIADQMLTDEQKDAVADGFEHVEHEETGEGVHEKYLALVDMLEQEAQVA